MALSEAERKRNQRRRQRAKELNARIWAPPAKGPRTPDQLDAQRELARLRSEVAVEAGVAVGWVTPDLELAPGAVLMERPKVTEKA